MGRFNLRTKRKTSPEKVIVITENLVENLEHITFTNKSNGEKLIKIQYFDEVFEFSGIKELVDVLATETKNNQTGYNKGEN